MRNVAYIHTDKLEVDSLARFLAGLMLKTAPDMSGDIWKALGSGMQKRFERHAEELIAYLKG